MRQHGPTWISLLVLGTVSFIASCDEPSVQGPEIPDWDGSFEVTEPAPPVLTPCPDGWVEVEPTEPGDVTTCDPWPAGDPVTLPVLTPCPEGWREAAPAGEGEVATCEPPGRGDVAARPQLTPCPPGWREVEAGGADGVTACDPFPESGRDLCDDDEVHLPGTPGCATLGTPCPDDGWAPDLPLDRDIVYVRSRVPPGGDGTREAPFDTIAAAIAVAGPGTVIAIGPGVFGELVVIPAEVTLWGACVDGTVVRNGLDPGQVAVIEARGPGSAIRNLRITGDLPGILIEGSDASLDVADVSVHETFFAGIIVRDGGSLTADGLAVRDTEQRLDDELLGRGLVVESGASAVVSRAVFEWNSETGVACADLGSTLVLRGSVVGDTECTALRPDAGTGVLVSAGCHAEVLESAIERNRLFGVMTEGAGSSLRLSDVVVRDIMTDCGDVGGEGLIVQLDAEATVVRGWITDNREAGIGFYGAATHGTLEHVVVAGTESTSDGYFGDGLVVDSGAWVDASNILLVSNLNAGIHVGGDSTRADLRDVVVEDTMSRDVDGLFGAGIAVEAGASVVVRRAELTGNHEEGISVRGREARLEGSDMLISGTLPAEMPDPFTGLALGTGIAVRNQAEAFVETTVITDSSDVGAMATLEGTVLEMSDVVVRDTVGPGEGFAAGVRYERGATGVVERCLLERNGVQGFVVTDDMTSVIVSDLVVRDSTSRPDEILEGVGLAVSNGGHVELAAALFTGNRSSGVLATDEDTFIDLRDIVVRGTRIIGAERSGAGITVLDGADAEATRIVLEDNEVHGVVIHDASAVIEDLVVRGTGLDGAIGDSAVDVSSGAGVSVERALLERNRVAAALRVDGTGSLALCDTVVIRDTSAETDEEIGTGVEVSQEEEAWFLEGVWFLAGAWLTRAVIERSRAFGIVSTGAIRLEDSVVRHTAARASDGLFGRGASVMDMGSLNLTRVVVLGNREVAIAGYSWGRISLYDVVVAGTLERECADDGCAGQGAGHGLGIYDNVGLNAEAFRIVGSASCAVQIANHDGGRRGDVRLHDGEVSNNAVGICLQVEEFDISQVTDRVIYRDNGANLSTDPLDVPDPGW